LSENKQQPGETIFRQLIIESGGILKTVIWAGAALMITTLLQETFENSLQKITNYLTLNNKPQEIKINFGLPKQKK